MNNVIVWDGFKLIGLCFVIGIAPLCMLGLWVLDKYENCKRKRKYRK